ncbi:MAG: hypothetical protein LBR73_08625 [Oscillospiraceae bacterium]|jgi:nitroreductase|nr:hypothetical protein [Oscillospiraceae bacterium]
MSAYETIFTRRSVRQYDPTPLSAEELALVQTAIDAAEQLPGQKAAFEIVDSTALKGCAAPHAILAYADDSDIALSNVGYTLQAVDLHLQEHGFGTLWMGMAKPLNPKENYQILLAFGKTGVPMRNGLADTKRKGISVISNADNAVARAVQIAPSAMNAQPWALTFSAGQVLVKSVPSGVAKLLAPKMQKIDHGIALRHAVLALTEEGKRITSLNPQGSGKGFAVAVHYAA